MRYVHAVLHWLRPILAAALIATPLFIGVVWQHRTAERRTKLDNVCVVLQDVHGDFQAIKDYLAPFVTDQKGHNFVAGLPVPPKPDC